MQEITIKISDDAIVSLVFAGLRLKKSLSVLITEAILEYVPKLPEYTECIQSKALVEHLNTPAPATKEDVFSVYM